MILGITLQRGDLKVRPLYLSQACEGFIHYNKATGKSPHTVLDYGTTLKKLRGFFKDKPPIASLSREKLVAFFAWLQDGYLSEPDGVAPRGKIKLAPKSIANIHTNLSSFWSWAAQEGFVAANVIRTIDPPAFTPPAVETLSKEDVSLLLKACDSSRTWKTRPTVTNRRPSSNFFPSLGDSREWTLGEPQPPAEGDCRAL